MRIPSRRMLIVVPTILWMLCAGSAAQARSGNPMTAPTDSTTTATVRNNLTNLIGWIQAHAQSPGQQANVQSLQLQVSSLTDDQLTMVANAINTTSDLAAFTTVVDSLITRMPIRLYTPPGGIVLSPAISATLFPPPYDVCDPSTGSPYFSSQIPSDTQLIFDTTVTIDSLKAAADIVNFNVCQTTFVVAGEGTNVAGCVVTMLLTAVIDGLQLSKDALTFCDSNASQAEVTAAWHNTEDIDSNLVALSNDLNGLLHDASNQLTSITTSLSNKISAVDTQLTNQMASVDTDIANRIVNTEADLINEMTSVDTDINNHLNALNTTLGARATQIDNEVATFQTLEVRMQIEHSLASNVIVGLFELPSASGGYLETVRAIVSDTISKLIAAGQTVNGATKWLGLGDTALSQGQYKSAYANYVTAYTTAVK